MLPSIWIWYHHHIKLLGTTAITMFLLLQPEHKQRRDQIYISTCQYIDLFALTALTTTRGDKMTWPLMTPLICLESREQLNLVILALPVALSAARQDGPAQVRLLLVSQQYAYRPKIGTLC